MYILEDGGFFPLRWKYMTDRYRGKCRYDRVKYLIGVQGSSVLGVHWLICLLGDHTALCLCFSPMHSSSFLHFHSIFCHFPHIFNFSEVFFSFFFIIFFLQNDIWDYYWCAQFKLGQIIQKLMWDICSYLKTRDVRTSIKDTVIIFFFAFEIRSKSLTSYDFFFFMTKHYF